MASATSRSLLSSRALVLLLSSLVFFCGETSQSTGERDFLRCVASSSKSSARSYWAAHSPEIYTPSNSSFLNVLNSAIFDLRFISRSIPKPSIIVIPSTEPQVQAVVVCAQKHQLLVKVRSGGHDMEGISYTSLERPYILLDMQNLSAIDVDIPTETAWIQAGATVGQAYYAIASKSPTLGFPAGACSTIGTGGHISGGGYGMMIRMYGMAADHAVDARIVLSDGRIADRKTMGEDLFWAIRGAGSSGFGIVLAWKVQLVTVPPIVTVFTVNRTLSRNATELVHKWQLVAYRLPKELTMNVRLGATNDHGALTITASFFSLYLGRSSELLDFMAKSFPELGLARNDCSEMPWIDSVMYFSSLPSGLPLERLLSRSPRSTQSFFKIKLDNFQKPVPLDGLRGMWNELFKLEAGIGRVILVPHGGIMDEISPSHIPYPHRVGNIFHAFYSATWSQNEGSHTTDRMINWVRDMYDYMTPYVSASPARGAYVNYRDLDLGVNTPLTNASYTSASIWGTKYFGSNFDRLVRVKTRCDPHNFFRSEQSIPSLAARR